MWLAALIAKPICLFLFFLVIRSATRAFERRMQDGKLKQLLFRRIS
jgi:hypothetical protein